MTIYLVLDGYASHWVVEAFSDESLAKGFVNKMSEGLESTHKRYWIRSMQVDANNV